MSTKNFDEKFQLRNFITDISPSGQGDASRTEGALRASEERVRTLEQEAARTAKQAHRTGQASEQVRPSA